MPTGYLSRELLRQRTARHDRGPGLVQRVDRISFDADLESKVVHESGMVDFHGVATRGGVAFIYEEPEGEVREFRPWPEVSDPESLKGLVGAPYTVDHPGDGVDDDLGLGEVTIDNARGLVHGVVLSPVEPEELTGLVKVWIRVWTKEAIAAIEGGKVELSCGYTTKLLDWRQAEDAELVRAMQLGPELGVAANGERYDYVQTDIRYNHISGVDQGRAGPVARLRADKATHIMKIKIDKRGTYVAPKWLVDSITAQGAKEHTDAGEVLSVEIEGRDPMTLPMEMIDQMLAAIGIGGKAAEAGPSLPEPELDLEPPITADAGEEEEETTTDAEEEEEAPKMDAKMIAKMIKDGIAAAMPAAAAQVTDAVTTRSRDRADMERQAALVLGPAFDYRAHKDHSLAVEVLKADKSPKLALAEDLAERARKGDRKAAGKLEAMMEAVIDARRDAMDSSGDLGRAMFEVANQDAGDDTEADERPAWEKRNDSLTRTSQGQTPTEADKAA